MDYCRQDIKEEPLLNNMDVCEHPEHLRQNQVYLFQSFQRGHTRLNPTVNAGALTAAWTRLLEETFFSAVPTISRHVKSNFSMARIISYLCGDNEMFYVQNFSDLTPKNRVCVPVGCGLLTSAARAILESLRAQDYECSDSRVRAHQFNQDDVGLLLGYLPELVLDFSNSFILRMRPTSSGKNSTARFEVRESFSHAVDATGGSTNNGEVQPLLSFAVGPADANPMSTNEGVSHHVPQLVITSTSYHGDAPCDLHFGIQSLSEFCSHFDSKSCTFELSQSNGTGVLTDKVFFVSFNRVCYYARVDTDTLNVLYTVCGADTLKSDGCGVLSRPDISLAFCFHNTDAALRSMMFRNSSA